ncbi:hypothetical protein L207DRAFT_534601 [Hyaloscypha variabilis F]|uniref:Uncharacterized protein n=1 Tax=Hyaloscypha variabilis (strain UAMH 11265 / GT02V1 / F) TaxID=1149755 RepID=A0A2J6R6V8_HYAVF|nr:hypothetical protein L207DRAFT_534601 [Hyaloscypha variabilis F]
MLSLLVAKAQRSLPRVLGKGQSATFPRQHFTEFSPYPSPSIRAYYQKSPSSMPQPRTLHTNHPSKPPQQQTPASVPEVDEKRDETEEKTKRKDDEAMFMYYWLFMMGCGSYMVQKKERDPAEVEREVDERG